VESDTLVLGFKNDHEEYGIYCLYYYLRRMSARSASILQCCQSSHLLCPYYSSPVTADGQVLFLVATGVGLSVDLSTRPSVGPSRRMV